MEIQSGAMEIALAGLFDYAGLFPPAELTIGAAVQNYFEYRHGQRAWALGCMVVDANQMHSLYEGAGNKACDLRLSVVTADANPKEISRYLADNLPIEVIEIKRADLDVISHIRKNIPTEVGLYLELPMESNLPDSLQVMQNAGIRAKLRMGGIITEAFPSPASVASAIKVLADSKMAFKATAGLHHPLRSRHPFTYQHDSEAGMMHGFINLLCASALLWFGGETNEATWLLEEQDSRAWQISATAIRWRAWEWSTEQLREVRKHFLTNIGTCSFTEPMEDLETLGWL